MLYIYAVDKRPGRPKKAPASKKGELLAFRLREAERETFQQAADIGGIALSAWVRERLRRAAVKELQEVGLRAPFLAELYPQN